MAATMLSALSMMLLVLMPGGYLADPEIDQDAMDFLKSYGYMGEKSPNTTIGAMPDEDVYPMALNMYQDYMGLNRTGMYDEETRAMMKRPRCGMPDIMVITDMHKRRRKRYTIQGSRWDKTDLTYRFVNYSPDLQRTTIERNFRDAFAAWSDVTRLTFRKVTSGSADIEILFASGNHGDGNAFDGRGSVLAHAYYPSSAAIGGDAHFDEAETWTNRVSTGINLFQVAVHEIGHSLGLGHSTVRSAIMYPTYTGYTANFALDSDDILGIQAIYGAPTTPRPTPRTTPRPTPGPTPIPTRPVPGDREAFCTEGSFDAVVLFNGDTIAFQGLMYAKLNTRGIVSGYPRRIQDDWPGLTGPVDAVLERPGNTEIYIFKESQYWRYAADPQGRPVLVSGYPRLISAGFPGLPNSIDAALVWGRNGRTYVFKGSQYYRLRRNSGRVDYGYPRSLGAWRLPENKIDASFVWLNRKTYFFADKNYYRFDDSRVAVDRRTSIPYPRPIADWWLNCPSGSQQNIEMEEEVDENSFTEVPGFPSEWSPEAPGFTSEGSPEAPGFTSEWSPEAPGFTSEGSPEGSGFPSDGRRQSGDLLVTTLCLVVAIGVSVQAAMASTLL